MKITVFLFFRNIYQNIDQNSQSILRVANGMFVQQNFTVNPYYMTLLRQYYEVEMEHLNFGENFGSARR